MKAAIVGGGPAGVFFAIKLLEKFPDVKITIFDDKLILSTLLPTGNGRCNITYAEYDPRELVSYYPRGDKFLLSVFSRYGVSDLISDFETYGIKTYIQDDLRIFPTADSAAFVKKKLLEQIFNKVIFERKKVTQKLDGFDVTVLATGLKYGADLAKLYGHTIVELKPALTGLKIQEEAFETIPGVSLNNVIFTNEGVSGPYIYKISSINAYQNFPYKIKIPLLDTDLLSEKVKQNPKKLFKNVVSELIPKSLAHIIVHSDKQCANTTKDEIQSLNFLELTVIGVDNKGEIVHAGGVSLDEIDKNMKSKIVTNLWIIGELLDIDGFTGGFNLQNCWSTAAIAAEDVANYLSNL